MLLNRYLNKLQEQYSMTVSLSDISGVFNTEWTDCYKKRCVKLGTKPSLTQKYIGKICQSDCIIRAANKAVISLGSIRKNCSTETDHQMCLERILKKIEMYKGRIQKEKEEQVKNNEQIAKLREEGIK